MDAWGAVDVVKVLSRIVDADHPFDGSQFETVRLTIRDAGLAIRDAGLAIRDKGFAMRDKRLGIILFADGQTETEEHENFRRVPVRYRG